MTTRGLALGIFLAMAWLLSQTPLPGQDKKDVKKDKPATKEVVFKGTLTSVEQEGTHCVSLKKDQVYTITADSRGLITKVRIENGQGQKLASLSGSSTFKAPEEGVFRLVVFSPGGSSGQYVVRVRPLNLTPTIPGEILTVGPDGLTIEAVLTKDDPLDKVRQKHCRIYDVKMKMGATYVIDLTSKQFDAFLRLESAGGKQLAQDDDSGGGNNARIRFTAPADNVYRIVATSFGTETGLFMLKVRNELKEPRTK